MLCCLVGVGAPLGLLFYCVADLCAIAIGVQAGAARVLDRCESAVLRAVAGIACHDRVRCRKSHLTNNVLSSVSCCPFHDVSIELLSPLHVLRFGLIDWP